MLGHQLAGDHLEQGGYPDPMVLANHFRRGSLPVRAIRWYREAAEQALRATDLTGAIARADLGLGLIDSLEPERRADLALETAGALRLTQAEAHLWRAEFHQAVTRGTEAIQGLRPGLPLWFRATGQMIIGVAKHGRIDEVGQLADWALATEADPDADDAQVICLAWAVSFLIMAGRTVEADRLFAQAVDRVTRLAKPDPQAHGLLNQARALRASAMGDQVACLDALEASLAAFEQAGDVRNVSTVRANIGFILAEMGVWERAESVLREALGEGQRLGLTELEAVVQHNLGRVLAIRGELAAGEQLEQQAVESFARQGDPRLEGLARAYLAEIKFLAGAPAEAEAQARVALDLLQAAPRARVMAQSVQARAALIQKRIEEALAEAQKAIDELDRLGSIDEGEAEVRLVYAECLDAAGARTKAVAVIEEACQRLRQRSAAIADFDLRKRFLCDVPVHARTLMLAITWTTLIEIPPESGFVFYR